MHLRVMFYKQSVTHKIEPNKKNQYSLNSLNTYSSDYACVQYESQMRYSMISQLTWEQLYYKNLK